ncbi:Acetyltransferase (GNAT) family protein [Roseovarius albus]|uniref:Acetyltransferase (GNAT) family protein n=1 Tax=Roseovarius albus TaxID=1247867 RepID=A0A1X6YVX2_9RHOB|nr:GNAT family N-acetyltransferase [Roseovarius albus]SLN32487.1 Acetyltransferase (GNAT) family protein [Roseovarius albus]
MMPTIETLYKALEHTWPAASHAQLGPWQIRDGQGGGKRVSAATLVGDLDPSVLVQAENEMQALGQGKLFMIRKGEDAFDALLEEQGYEVIDPVNIYVGDVNPLAVQPPRTASFAIWEPMAIQADIWNQGGIGPARLDVMWRVEGPRTSLFGRADSRPAATGFVAVHEGVAMVHALEVLPRHRRSGMGRYLMQQAALWAQDNCARYISAVCTQENTGANGLYANLGMSLVGGYHYRQKQETTA